MLPSSRRRSGEPIAVNHHGGGDGGRGDHYINTANSSPSSLHGGLSIHSSCPSPSTVSTTSSNPMRRSLLTHKAPQKQQQTTMAVRGPATLSPEQELEVIKAVLLRESYLVRLRQLEDRTRAAVDKAVKEANQQKRNDDIYLSMPAEMIELLELVRTSTVEVVEAIGRWKLSKLDATSEYIWNRQNYLTRIPSDMDFLANFQPLMNWLRFDVVRNPFIIPRPMLGHQASTDSKEIVGAYEAAYLQCKRPIIRPPRPEPSPYLTPIINDLDYLPAPKVKKPVEVVVRDRDKESKPSTADPGLRALTIKPDEEVHPATIITADDVARIRRAEQAILDEERARGRYVRGDDGQLVLQQPQHHHETTAFDAAYQASRRRGRSLNGTVEATTPAPSPGRTRGHEGSARTRELCNDEGGEVAAKQEEMYGDKSLRYHTPRLPMDAPNDQPALKKARKMGSDLFLLTVAGTSGRMKPLARPNRFVRMDHDMEYLRAEVAEKLQAAATLQTQVEGLQGDLFPPNFAAKRGREDMRSGDTDDEGEGRSMEEEMADLRAKLRVACGQLWDIVEATRYQARSLQAELNFKLQCKGYLEQVRHMGETKGGDEGGMEGGASLLQERRVKLRAGEILLEDEQVAISLEDRSATIIQARVRGLITRPWVERYKVRAYRAACMMQALFRGCRGRAWAKIAIRQRRAAITIQKKWRASRVKHLLQELRLTSGRARAAIPLQRFFRGYLGRRRAAHRRVFVESSRGAQEAVNHKGLIPEDLTELADRLLATLKDPAEAFPPGALLGLLRLIACLLATPDKPDMAMHYNLLGVGSRLVLTSMELTWSNAMRMLYRANKLLRKLRSLALDPIRSPSRILYVPSECLQLAAELRKDPLFSEEAMEGLGKGSRCAVGLFRYYTCLERVYMVQDEFRVRPSDCIPIWLASFRSQQKKRRLAHLQVTARRVAVLTATAAVERRIADELHFGVEKAVLDAECTSLSLSENKILHRIDLRLQKLDKQLHDKGETALKRLQEQRKHLERSYNVVKQERVIAEADALAGSGKARLVVRGLRQDEYRAEEALRAKTNDVQICVEANELHLQQSQQGDRTYPFPIVELAEHMGRKQAKLQIAEMYRDEFVASIGGKYYIPALEGQELATYAELNGRVLDLNRLSLAMMRQLHEESDRYEAEIYRVDVETIMEDIEARRWDKPTPTQCRQEEQEDEAAARAESEAMLQFLPPSVAEQLSENYLGPEGRTIRSSPVLLVVARDCPFHVKRQVLAFLDAQFPSMFVHFGYQVVPAEQQQQGSDEGKGKQTQRRTSKAGKSLLDVWPYQATFMDGKHVTAEFDVGSSYATRRAFLAAMFSLRNGLSPSPRCILITGGPKDKIGLGCRWEERTMPGELSSLTDKDLRFKLQLINEYLYNLAQPAAQQDLAAIMACETPPSDRRLPPRSYVLVMKVVLILLAPLLRPRGPLASNPTLIWQAARLILRNRTDLARRLQGVQFSLIDQDTLAVIEGYMKDPDWPQRRQLSMLEDPLLMCLSQWATLMLDYSSQLSQRAGGPEPITAVFKTNIFEAVISIVGHDAEGGAQLYLTEALPCLARLVAQNTRVHVDVIKLDDALQVVQCYQFKTRALFTIYNPTTSLWDYCFLDIARVGKLLEPNFTEIDSFVVKYPPNTLSALYQLLVRLLKYNTEWVGGQRVRRLVCERTIDSLYESTRKVNGHRINIMAFEDAKGELSFQIRAPDLGREVYRCTVDFKQLRWLYWHGDKQLEAPFIRMLGAGGIAATEGDEEGDDDTVTTSSSNQTVETVVSTVAAILHPIMDRLVIAPTALTCVEKAMPSARVSSRVGRPDTVAPEPMLAARVRRGGGPGRHLFRRPYRLYRQGWQEFFVVVSVLECGGPGGLLRVQVYDLTTATTTEFRVGSAERATLLPAVDDGYITYTETEDAREFVAAVLSRVRICGEDDHLVWDVRLQTVDRDLGVFGAGWVCAGLDARKEGMTVQIEVQGKLEQPVVREHCIPLAVVMELTSDLMEDGSIGMEQDGPQGLMERYFADPSYRSCLCAWAENTVQVRDQGAVQLLGIAYGEGGWVTLLTHPPGVADSVVQGSEGAVAVDNTTELQDAFRSRSLGPSTSGSTHLTEQELAAAAPRLIKSMWEKRLLERCKTVMAVMEESCSPWAEEQQEAQVQQAEDGYGASPEESAISGDSSSAVSPAMGGVMGQVEVRVWECFTGGANSRPDQVYRIMVIDKVRRGVATISLSGTKRVPELLGMEWQHLLEPHRQKALVRHLVQHCLRLNILDLSYRKVFSVGVRMPANPLEPHQIPEPIPPAPRPNPFVLSGLPVKLIVAESRCISGVRCRLLTYTFPWAREDNPEEFEDWVAFVAVIPPQHLYEGKDCEAWASAAPAAGYMKMSTAAPAAAGIERPRPRQENVRASLMLQLCSILQHLNLEEADVKDDKKAVREIVRSVAHFLRFTYQEDEEGQCRPNLILPYYLLALQPGKTVASP